MTNWERWLSVHKRKDIICAVGDYDGTGRCDKNCILYHVCKKNGCQILEERYKACDEFLDAEELPTRDAVIINLASMLNEARQNGWDGYVKTLDRAIELLEEGADE